MEGISNWKELTPDQKRQARFKRWLEAPGVKFKDKAAEQLLLSGDLHGRTEDGYSITTDKAVYSQKEGRLTTDEEVLITGPFLSIEGQGLSYEVATQTLEIKSKTKTSISRGSWIS